jgi:hypothetical protein
MNTRQRLRNIKINNQNNVITEGDWGEQDPDWWRRVVWRFGMRCNGWTLWQIFKNDPTYLDWIQENFTFKFNQGYLLSAVNDAVDFMNKRKEQESG